MATLTTTVGVKVNVRALAEITVGSTEVLLNTVGVRALLVDLSDQLETAEIPRVNVECLRGASKIKNFPLSRTETRKIIRELDVFLNG